MIRIIRGHNRLNGYRFSTLEFGLVGLLTLGFGLFFLLAGAFPFGIAAIGIAANCVPVAWLGIGARRAGEADIGLRAMLRPAVREAALREYPSMQRDTYILAGATLLPFVVALAVLLETRVNRT